MIELLSGALSEKRPTEIVLDVGGVGYGLLIPTSTYEALGATGSAARLFCHLHVREDILQLYGFASRQERAVFRIMLGVSGVGPKLALAALSAMRPGEIKRHVLSGDSGFLTRIPGVGKKTAARLVIELKDRLVKVDLGDAEVPDSDAAAVSDAAAALEALGFSRAAAEKAVTAVTRANPDVSSAEDLIRLALRE